MSRRTCKAKRTTILYRKNWYSYKLKLRRFGKILPAPLPFHFHKESRLYQMTYYYIVHQVLKLKRWFQQKYLIIFPTLRQALYDCKEPRSPQRCWMWLFLVGLPPTSLSCRSCRTTASRSSKIFININFQILLFIFHSLIGLAQSILTFQGINPFCLCCNLLE